MSYNPLFDLVTGTVLILVPLISLVGLGIGLLVSCKPGREEKPSPPEPDPSVSDEISRSLGLLNEHQVKLCRELQDLSEENHESLRILIRETAHIRSLLEREISLREERDRTFS